MNCCVTDAVPNCFVIDEYSMHDVVVDEVVIVVVVVVLSSETQLKSVVNVTGDVVVLGTLVVSTGLVFVLT